MATRTNTQAPFDYGLGILVLQEYMYEYLIQLGGGGWGVGGRDVMLC